MWPLAIFLMGVVLFYWLAICGTIWFCGNALFALLKGHFIKAMIWACLAYGMFAWWQGTEVIPHPWDFDEWLRSSAIAIGITIGLVLLFKLNKWRFQRQNVPPFGTLPEITGNVIPFVKATREERERVMQIQGHKCANPYCNMDLRSSVPHWDHIIPRSQGGTDSVHNMQYLCDTCNLNKKDMNWLEFLFRYATNMGQDPNQNQAPWKKWVLTRTQNGLQCQG